MSADLDAFIALMPLAGHLGLVLDEADASRVIIRLDWAPHLCTTGGILHGGVLMSLADTAGALVTFLGLPEGKTTATITSTSHMFRPVSGGTVRAVAVPVHRGRTTVTAETSVFDARGPAGRPDRPGPGGQVVAPASSYRSSRRLASSWARWVPGTWASWSSWVRQEKPSASTIAPPAARTAGSRAVSATARETS